MISIWRLIKLEHSNTAFDGEGARRYGGRWNEIGTPMVYTSETLSLAALEFFVNLDAFPGEDLNLCAIEAELSKELIEVADNIPSNWNTHPIPLEIQAYGSDWIKKNRNVALKVPSVLIQNEYNYLLNPNHPDFKKIKIKSPAQFSFDDRMWNKK